MPVLLYRKESAHEEEIDQSFLDFRRNCLRTPCWPVRTCDGLWRGVRGEQGLRLDDEVKAARQILIYVGLTVVGSLSSAGTIILLNNAHVEFGAPKEVMRDEVQTLVVASLGPIGTVIAGLRWLRYRFF